MNKTGFGFLRLPMAGKEINYHILNPMVDRFMELGGNYFDTAYTYLDGLSEEALRKALVERHPRETYRIADKLPGWKLTSHGECQAYFDEQLKRCGVDYFDVYLIHWLNQANYQICQEHDAFAFLRKVKAEGKAGKIGFSYYDSPELLDQILTEHPEVDYVQVQINYLDWDSVSIQSRRCYEVACAHGKSVIVMEPVKGGNLAKLPAKADMLLRQHSTESAASWAIRFASGLEQVEVVLSGMNAMDQLEDNMRDFPVLSQEEADLLNRVAELIRSQTAIACTGCGYCAPNCPMEISIPAYFALYNDYARNPGEDWKMQSFYDSQPGGRASSCIGCRACEQNCPQKLPITDYVPLVAMAFER